MKLFGFFITLIFLVPNSSFADTVVPKYFYQATNDAATAETLFTLAIYNSPHKVGSAYTAWPWTIYKNNKAIKLNSQLGLIKYLTNSPDTAFGLFGLTIADFHKHNHSTVLSEITKPITQVKFIKKYSVLINPDWVVSVADNYDLKLTTYVVGTKQLLDTKDKAINSLIAANSKKYNVSPALIRAVIRAESAFNPMAKSHAGAIGLMQVMPATAKTLGIYNQNHLYDPAVSIATGTRYLSEQIKKFKNIDLALAAYNAGPGAVSKYRGIPPYKETQNYVKKVNKFYREYLRQEGSNG